MPDSKRAPTAGPVSKPGLFAISLKKLSLPSFFVVATVVLSPRASLDDVWSRISISQSPPLCRAPLPSVQAMGVTIAEHPLLRAAALHLNKDLDAFFQQHGLESAAIAVVTGTGAVYEGFRGVQRANETNGQRTVDRHSIYRVASISKLFATVKTLMLRDAGLLNLCVAPESLPFHDTPTRDDPITGILSDFPSAPGDDPVTVRQLMTHMSGLNRECPPGSSNGSWPASLDGSGPPGYSGLPFPDRKTFMAGIVPSGRVAPPYTFPVYSNTAFSVLGLVNLAVTKRHEGEKAPQTHAELMHRDIFVPLGLNGSSFIVSEVNKDKVVVPSVKTDDIDANFGDVTNPAGGQMSSLSDLVKIVRTFVDPTRKHALLRPYTIREWLRPLHVWWDDYSEVGAVWEILRFTDSHSRNLRLFIKLGELDGIHSLISINPTTGFGTVILTSGPTMETIPLNDMIMSRFQPAFEAINEELIRKSLVGTWVSDDGRYKINVDIISGSLFATQYTIDDIDVLKTINDGTSTSTALWHTGNKQFRLAKGVPGAGCLFEWVSLDDYAHDRGYATNMIRLTGNPGEETLQIPATGAELRRRL
ncbi:hypothetical protein HGRIS_000338 [Hohenbuehelia grisea]|uniref:Beta-lactamase-related domain-containing protein n=1 Tax=Hohenbuehelia grisea TaxID=104357 RepID=A0ABR3JQR8_9AGAR